MEAKWLEDFVALVETRSFSRAAQQRFVSQPAFSRRIQALEAWIGTDLIDRSAYPTRLTAAGETFYPQALDMLARLSEARNLLRGAAGAPRDVVELAVPHTLALTYVPSWLSQLEASLGPVNMRVLAFNVHDAVLRLVQGGCDLLMVYHHARQPMQLDPARYDMLRLATEEIAFYCTPDAAGRPRYALPGTVKQPLPYLAYPGSSYLGQLAETLLAEPRPTLRLKRVYESDLAEALKVMALAGHGLAFLLASAVQREVAAGALVRVHEQAALTMEVRLYRERPGPERPGKPSAESLWRHVLAGSR
jgi:DNA-binding transcriptional LysR family regulator